jgi:DNA-binding transcriptional LysR family regulator
MRTTARSWQHSRATASASRTSRTFIVGDDVRAGRLVPILRAFTVSVGAINVVYASRRHLSAKVRAFSEFLAQHFADTEWSPAKRR